MKLNGFDIFLYFRAPSWLLNIQTVQKRGHNHANSLHNIISHVFHFIYLYKEEMSQHVMKVFRKKKFILKK